MCLCVCVCVWISTVCPSVRLIVHQSVIYRWLFIMSWHDSTEPRCGGSWNHLKISRWEVLWSSLRWRHNVHDSDWNHQPHDYLLNRSFRRSSKKTSKLRVTGLCAGNSPGTGQFPAQMASNAENVSIWCRHHGWNAFWVWEIKTFLPRYLLLTSSQRLRIHPL